MDFKSMHDNMVSVYEERLSLLRKDYDRINALISECEFILNLLNSSNNVSEQS